MKLLSSLRQSGYRVKYSKEFTQKFKIVVPLDSNSKLLSFGMSSLITSILLDFTIDVKLRRNELHRNMKPNELKELLLLCTKDVRFSSNGQFYLQKDSIAMGYPLGPVIAGISMIEL